MKRFVINNVRSDPPFFSKDGGRPSGPGIDDSFSDFNWVSTSAVVTLSELRKIEPAD